MTLELSDFRTEGMGNEARLWATLSAPEYGYSVETSCWPDCIEQYGDKGTQLELVKNAIPAAREKLRLAKLETAINLAAAMALPDDPAPTEAEPDPEQPKAAQVAALQSRQGQLDQFEAAFEAEVRARVQAFYNLAKQFPVFVDKPEREAQLEGELAEWLAANPDTSSLAGVV